MTATYLLWLAVPMFFTMAAAAPVVEPWIPEGVSSDLFESHAAFDPKTNELLFVRSSKKFAGWRILTSRCVGGQWSSPMPAPFAGPGVEADPYFTEDGRSVYFISTRAIGSLESKDLDIWRVDRNDGGGWSSPVRLPEPVNSAEAEWFPRPARDSWLYFGSNRSGGHGGNDIWRAHLSPSGVWAVENLGAAINTGKNEYEPMPSPDGTRLTIMADDGLYESRRTSPGWSKREKLGPAINVNGSEIGPVYSPSGSSLLFSRDTGEPKSGEFFVWRLQGRENWPPECKST